MIEKLEAELQLELARLQVQQVAYRKAKVALKQAMFDAGLLKPTTVYIEEIRQRADLFKSDVLRKAFGLLCDALTGLGGAALFDLDEELYSKQ